MHIAILVTNTDDSEFARRHPRDPEMFRDLISPHRPDWQFTGFDLPKGEAPGKLGMFDGVIVSGSPASVNDDAPWVGRLLATIRNIEQQRLPLFGACFGHQAIARALGGTVGNNPSGWQLGYTETRFLADRPWIGEAGQLGLYAAHKEQVLDPPEGADILSTSPQCPVGAFAIGDHVFTTQYHPEMPHQFVTALIDEISDDIGPDVEKTARDSITRRAENDRFALWLVAFFEHARKVRE